MLQELHNALGPYYAGTLSSEGNSKTLMDWFYTLDFILDSTDASKNKFGDLADENPGSDEYTFLQAGAAAAWVKAEEYYAKCDESAAYYAANILHPKTKWTWFEQRWGDHPIKKAWLEGEPKKNPRSNSKSKSNSNSNSNSNSDANSNGVKGLVRELWEEEYKGKYSPDPSTLTDSNKTSDIGNAPPQRKNPDDPFEALHRHKQVRAKPKGTSSDLYTAYVSMEPEYNEEDALKYWNARVTSQPDLARFALDMLAIPMMSAECERVFSSAKHLITDARNRLRPDIIEANECLKHWFGKPEEKPKGLGKPEQEPKGSEEPRAATTSDHKAEASDEEVLADMNNGDESDVQDGVYYEVESDGEVVWKD